MKSFLLLFGEKMLSAITSHYFFIACILAFVLRFDTLFVSAIEMDDAHLMTMSFFSNHGFRIYRDFFTEHPFMDVLFAQMFFKFFDSSIAPRMLHFANIIIIFIKLHIVNLMFSKLNIKNNLYKISSLLLIALLYSQPWSKASYGEFYTSLLTLVIIYILLFSQRLPYKHFIIGMLFVISFFTKQTAIFDFLAIFGSLVILRKKIILNIKRINVGSFLFGGLLSLGAIILYLYSKNILGTAFFHIFIFPIVYVTKGYPSSYLGSLVIEMTVAFIRIIKSFPLSFGLVAISSILIIKEASFKKYNNRNSLLIFFVLYLVFILFGILLMGRFYEHYLIPLIIPFGLIMPYFMISTISVRIKRTLTILLSILAILLVQDTISLPHIVSKDLEVEDLTQYIKNNSTSGEKILVLSQRIDLYYLTKRKGLFFGHFPDFFLNTRYNPATTSHYKARFYRELITTPPKFIVYQKGLLESNRFRDSLIDQSRYIFTKEYTINNVYTDGDLKIKINLYERVSP